MSLFFFLPLSTIVARQNRSFRPDDELSGQEAQEGKQVSMTSVFHTVLHHLLLTLGHTGSTARVCRDLISVFLLSPGPTNTKAMRARTNNGASVSPILMLCEAELRSVAVSCLVSLQPTISPRLVSRLSLPRFFLFLLSSSDLLLLPPPPPPLSLLLPPPLSPLPAVSWLRYTPRTHHRRGLLRA